MHAPAASARAASLAPEQLGNEFDGRQPFGQGVAVAAVRAEHHIIATEMRAHADGNGFLSDVSVTRAEDESALVRADQLLFADADQLHLPVARQQVSFGMTDVVHSNFPGRSRGQIVPKPDGVAARHPNRAPAVDRKGLADHEPHFSDIGRRWQNAGESTLDRGQSDIQPRREKYARKKQKTG
jgi:hypothetical protein